MSLNMLVLGLDASLARSSAAVVRVAAGLEQGQVIAEAEAEGGQGQAGMIATLAEQVLAEAARAEPGFTPAALGAIAATVGPGGFTGIRAALALAQGLAAGIGCQLVGVLTSEALAAAVPAGTPIAVLIDSRRGHRFVHVFGHGDALPFACALEALAASMPEGAMTFGDAPEATHHALPHARDVAMVGAARLAGLRAPLAASPLYLDPPAARPASGLRPAPAA